MNSILFAVSVFPFVVLVLCLLLIQLVSPQSHVLVCLSYLQFLYWVAVCHSYQPPSGPYEVAMFSFSVCNMS